MLDTTPFSICLTRSRILFLALFGVLALLGFGCGTDIDGGSSETPGPTVTPLLDTERETSEVVGPEGGAVSMTAADGTEYMLTLPADALLEETEISLTPILGIDDLPMSGGLVAGVHFEPSGLELFRTATLSVTLPSAPVVGAEESLAGFVYDDDGENLAFALTEATGSSFTVPVDHFSGAGAGAANRGELAGTSAAGSANGFIARLVDAIQTEGTDEAESILREWYEARVEPGLQAAVSSDGALERALGEYRRWLNAESAVSLPIDVSGLLSESEEVAADALGEAIARANDVCERNASFEEAEEALRWQRRAESVLPEGVLVRKGLDRGTVLNELCVQVVIERTSFPQAPVVGEPSLLEVVVGFAFGDGPTEFSSSMVAFVFANGATPAGATEFTDENGLVQLELTPDSGSVSIEVDACIGNGGFNGGQLVAGLVCQQAFIVRGLVIDPNEAEVSPGGTVPFAALLGGTSTNVVWTATGGSIDSSGLYTAGNREGSFQITATSVEDPSLRATATVRIIAEEFDPSLFFQGQAFGDLIDQFGRSYCNGKLDNKCVRLWFKGPLESARLEGCEVNQFNDCFITSWWGGALSPGIIAGNVFTADYHERRTSTTVRRSEFPCPVRVALSVEGNQVRLEGELKNFVQNTCGPDSTTSFTLTGFTKDLTPGR
jgi:hypothetical protein